MFQLLILILVGLAGVWLGSFLARRKKMKEAGSLEQARQAREKHKSGSKDRILRLFGTQNEIRNDDVEKLLGVSDATATNYLEELEKEGKIAQQGDTGRGVIYTIING